MSETYKGFTSNRPIDDETKALLDDYVEIIKAYLKCDDAKAEAALEKFCGGWRVDALSFSEFRIGLMSYLLGIVHSQA